MNNEIRPNKNNRAEKIEKHQEIKYLKVLIWLASNLINFIELNGLVNKIIL